MHSLLNLKVVGLMAAEGPTTAGSIEAKLRIDDSDWMAKLAAADAAARKLGSTDPHVDIHVDDNGAVTKLAAVDEAAKKLDGTSQRLNTSQKALNDTNGAGVQRWQMIAALIAALIPLIAPLAGYAVGVAGALAGMGAAGVLAIFGVVAAMKSATATGQAYSSALNSLKDSFDQLAQTAAVALLHDFQKAVSLVSAEMPALNNQISVFAGLLGQGALSVVRGVITAFNVMNPLFVRAAVYVDQLAAGFQKWTQDGGLARFVQYAITQLPVVAQTVGSLATAALHLIEAFAPLGTVVLAALTLLGAAINAIPVNVILEVSTAALAGFAAFKLWDAIAPILSTVAASVGALGASIEIASGPIGWITAGVSALAAAFAIGTVATSQQTQATNDYTSALNSDSDAIGRNVKLQAAKALQDSGAFAAAQKLGISAKTLTDATLGNADAYARVRSVIDPLSHKLDEAAAKQGQLTGKQAAQAAASATVVSALKTQRSALQGAIDGNKQLEDATGGANGAQQSQASQQSAVAAALGLTAGQAQSLADKQNAAATATDLLKQALDILNGKAISAAQAQNNFDSAIANSDKHINAQGNQIDRANTLLTGNTAAAVKNRGELIQQAQAAQAAAQAFRDNGGSADATKQKLIDMKQTIIDNAIAHGEDAAQVHALVDQFYKIPAKIPPTVIEVRTAAALAAVQAINRALDGIQRNINITMSVNHVDIQSVYNKSGTKQVFADGGTVRGPGGPKSDKVQAWVSPGEEIVANPYAAQWRSALKLMNSGAPKMRVAAAVARIAGGSVGGSVAPIVHNHYEFTINEATNGAQLAQQVANRQNAHAV